MKAGAIESAEAQAALEDSQHRVRSIALIHEQLSGTEHLDRIVFAEYRDNSSRNWAAYMALRAANRNPRGRRADRDGHPPRDSVRPDPQRTGDQRIEARIPGRANR